MPILPAGCLGRAGQQGIRGKSLWHRVVLPDWRGPVRVMMGYSRARSLMRAAIRRGTMAGGQREFINMQSDCVSMIRPARDVQQEALLGPMPDWRENLASVPARLEAP